MILRPILWISEHVYHKNSPILRETPGQGGH